jgi:hypothetical protein
MSSPSCGGCCGSSRCGNGSHRKHTCTAETHRMKHNGTMFTCLRACPCAQTTARICTTPASWSLAPTLVTIDDTHMHAQAYTYRSVSHSYQQMHIFTCTCRRTCTCTCIATAHLSLSLNTSMDVLYTLMARSVPSEVQAWYTFASLPAGKTTRENNTENSIQA